MYLKNKAFTLIEIMVWVLIVSIVIVSWFEAYMKIWIWKISLIEKTNMQKDSFYFSEKLFQIIKEWGTLDYEEYFNRKVIWTNFSSGNYLISSGFWNFGRNWFFWTTTYGDTFYYCLSWNGLVNKLGTTWCYSNTLNTNWVSMNWTQQRYWQYSYQFVDYNSNFDSDSWDEDGDWNLVWDDDDEFLWDWPIAFSWWLDVKELYLISWDKKTRTYIRWNVSVDPDKPVSETCTIDSSNVITWDWCRWTVEFLKLEWVDWWLDHDDTISDITQNDWLIDTWLIDKQFTGLDNLTNATSVVAWSSTDNYWKPIFSTWINVTEFKVYPYPNVKSEYFWRSTVISSNISPYVVLNLKIKPSWETRKKLKNEWKEINFNTTINLTDIYSK